MYIYILFNDIYDIISLISPYRPDIYIYIYMYIYIYLFNDTTLSEKIHCLLPVHWHQSVVASWPRLSPRLGGPSPQLIQEIHQKSEDGTSWKSDFLLFVFLLL